MTDNSIKRRLAISACRGWRQEALVNELLTGPVWRYRDGWTDHNGMTAIYLGQVRYSASRFYRLRSRLTSLGFTFHNNSDNSLSMIFPEEGI